MSLLQNYMIQCLAPIIEERIRQIILGVAREYNIDAFKVVTLLKTVNGNLEVFVFYNNKTIKRDTLGNIAGGIPSQVTDHIQKIFLKCLYHKNVMWKNNC